jgi:hypothetical protein
MTLTLDAGTPPIVTDAPATKFDPVTAMMVPPIEGPLEGETEFTVGAGVGWTGVSPPQEAVTAVTAAIAARRAAEAMMALALKNPRIILTLDGRGRHGGMPVPRKIISIRMSVAERCVTTFFLSKTKKRFA